MNELSDQRVERRLVLVGSILGMLAVVAGTFAAHVLDKNLEPKSIETFQIAVQYQMYHALAIFCAAWVYSRRPGRMPAAAGWMFAVGVLLFSGSLYLLVVAGVKWLGMVAPLGGVSLLIGWVMLGVSALAPCTKTGHEPAP